MISKHGTPTTLYNFHEERGAKLTNFSGFALPLWYVSAKDEHLSVRQHAGLFDISHMGVLKIDGADARPFLDRMLTNTLRKADRSIMTYAMILNEDAGILDDVMVGFINGSWLLIVNASNTEKIIAWLSQHKPDSVSITPMGATHAFIAVQGPKAVSIVGKTLGVDLSHLARFGMIDQPASGVTTLMRTGYTGEDGVELVISNDAALQIVRQLVEHGATPCGLAARDSLRIEAGLPLYGHELSESITPLHTRYPWVIDWTKSFIGKNALQQFQTQGILEVGVGVRCHDTLIPRQGYAILEGGKITSGTLPPNQPHAVALAQVPPHLSQPGTVLTVEIRNNQTTATVVTPPFFKRNP